MTELKCLLSLEMRSLFGINKALHTKDLKEKKRYRMLTGVWIFLILLAFLYVGVYVFALCEIGVSQIVPTYLAVISSALILMFSLFGAGGKIFGQKGYDILVSMPVKQSSIVLSRFMSLYISDLIFTLVVILPGCAVYGYCVKPDFLFYVIALIGALFIPAIPLVITTLLGAFIYSITSRLKSKNLIKTLLAVVFVIAVMFVSFSAGYNGGDMSNEQFAGFVNSLAKTLEVIYMPAAWFGMAAINFDLVKLLLFVVVSVISITVTVFIVTKCFNGIVRSLFNFSAKSDYKVGKMQNRSLLKTLYVKEAKRYFSSSIYVTNTIMGPILGAIISIALCVTGVDTIFEVIPLQINAARIVPFVFSAVFCMMTTTSTSISMEGKQIWIAKSLPVPTKTWLDAKILFNITLMLPFYLISMVALGIAVKPNVMELVWLILIPSVIMLLSVVLGIAINLKLYSFDWEHEATVVKQSASSMLGGFAGVVVSVLLIFVTVVIPPALADVFNILICALALLVTVLIYVNNNKTKIELL